ncbi:MAG: hypothetical protein AAF518_01495 [Spirochaetota bacterium]
MKSKASNKNSKKNTSSKAYIERKYSTGIAVKTSIKAGLKRHYEVTETAAAAG